MVESIAICEADEKNPQSNAQSYDPFHDPRPPDLSIREAIRNLWQRRIITGVNEQFILSSAETKIAAEDNREAHIVTVRVPLFDEIER